MDESPTRIDYGADADESSARTPQEIVVFIWGRGGDGQLGHGNSEDVRLPKIVEGLRGVRISQIACGGKHTVAVCEGGAVYSWGWNWSGQLGHGDALDLTEPKLVKQITLVNVLQRKRIVQVSAGADHTVAVSDAGDVYTWGGDPYGQLGIGGESAGGLQLAPAVVLGIHGKKVVQVACGGGHTVALTDAGDVYSWGRGNNGRLGHGTVDDVHTPRLVSMAHLIDNAAASADTMHKDARLRIVRIACGWSHTLAVAADGTAYAWGCGADGQLGLDDFSDRTRPTRIEFPDPFGEATNSQPIGAPRDAAAAAATYIVAISGGYYHSAALSANGVAYTWGWGEYGQLGHGIATSGSPNNAEGRPRRVAGALNGRPVGQIECGGFHTVALTVDNHVYAWGLAKYGQLGVDMPTPTHNNADAVSDPGAPLAGEIVATPTEVTALQPTIDGVCVCKVACGWWHTIAIATMAARINTADSLKRQRARIRRHLRAEIDRLTAPLVAGANPVEDDGVVDNALVEMEYNEDPHAAETASAMSTGLSSSASAVYPVSTPPKVAKRSASAPAISGEDNVDSTTRGKTPEQRWTHSVHASANQQRGSGNTRLLRKVSSFFAGLFDGGQSVSIPATSEEDKATRMWLDEILPKWDQIKATSKLKLLLRRGVPPAVRRMVWPLIIGNRLGLTPELYESLKRRLKQEILRNGGDETSSASLRPIVVDIPRTFPNMNVFKKDGPLYQQLLEVLAAYSYYQEDIGYVQGMSYLAAMFLLYMDPYSAFVCMCNTLDNHFFRSMFTMNLPEILKHIKIYELMFSKHLPRLFRRFQQLHISAEHYLLEWFLTIFSKSLPVDIASRVWDCFLLEGEILLFRVALGVLKSCYHRLITAEFEECVVMLKRLPSDLDEAQLFEAFETITVPPAAIRESYNLNYSADAAKSLFKPRRKTVSGTIAPPEVAPAAPSDISITISDDFVIVNNYIEERRATAPPTLRVGE